MRFVVLTVLCAGMGIAFASSVAAGPVRANAGGAIVADPLQLEESYQRELDGLQASTMKQQRMDGGMLTAEHAASLQRRLDRLNTHHRYELANNNPLSVDANGRAVDLRQVPIDWTNSRLFRVGAPF